MDAFVRSNLFRYSLGLAVAALGIFFLWTGIPFSSISPDLAEFVGAFRIAVGLLFAFKFVRLHHVEVMLWSHRQARTVRLTLHVGTFVALGLAAGIVTPLLALANFFITLFIFLPGRSKYFGLEEVYFQLTAFSLVLMNPGTALSLDQYIGFQSPLGSQPWLPGLNFLVMCMALVVLSGAVQKLSSPVWRKGLSFYYFVALPHLVRARFRWLKRWRKTCIALNYLTFVGQALLFFALAVPFVREVLFLEQLVFGSLLLVIVSFSFIAEIFALNFVFFLATSLLDLATEEGPKASQDVAVWPLFALSLVWFASSMRAFSFEFPGHQVFGRLARMTTALQTIGVFSEKHLFGIYVYQVLGYKDGNEYPVSVPFSDDGSCGKDQRFRPRIAMTATYKVTDACLRRRESHNDMGSFEEVIEDICANALKSRVVAKHGLEFVELRVKAMNPDTHYTPETGHWIDADWTVISRCSIASDGLDMEHWVNEPPEIRNVSRL